MSDSDGEQKKSDEKKSSGPTVVKSDIPYDPRFPQQNQTM